jgi:hypothetical protein
VDPEAGQVEAVYFGQGGGGPANIAELDVPGYKRPSGLRARS